MRLVTLVNPRICFVLKVFAALILFFGSCPPAQADEIEQVRRFSTGIWFPWLLAFAGGIVALVFAYRFFSWMVSQPEGDERMIEIADHVREGAKAYLYQQYRVVLAFFVVMMLILTYISYGLGTQSTWVPWAFATGGFFSGLAGWFGMKTATLASARTAHAAKSSLNGALQLAFRSGGVMGLVVVGLALLEICFWFAVLFWGVRMPPHEVTVTMLCFGMGASFQALFARVGGGIFTKAADVGADLVGKVEQGIPEDDPRNPATIADNVGDNVGDVAGMGADLYESYCGSILASAALGVAAFHAYPALQLTAMMLPLAIAGLGVMASVGGILTIHTKEEATQQQLLKALGRGIDGTGLVMGVATALVVWVMLVVPSATTSAKEALTELGFPHGFQLMGVWGAIVTGLVTGVLIGKWTERSTSEEYGPTRRIADEAVSGPATVIIAGIAEGLYSVWVPIVLVSTAILVSFGLCTGWEFDRPELFSLGLYGVGVASVGMLSTLGITLASDAYGPIADNAGGNAEMSGQPPIVRERTDALDSLGNTTAATGKGFAIGSAALTALALLSSYLEEVRTSYDRWARTSIPVEAVLDEQAAPVRKLSDKAFVVWRSSGEDSEAGADPMAYLLLNDSDSSATGLEETTWDEVPNGGTARLNLAGLLESRDAIEVSEATIPDFGRLYNFSIMHPPVLVGLFGGVMLAFVFCALTMKAVGRSATAMVNEVRRQFAEHPGIMEGTDEPDYARCVSISTLAAQREMIIPALLGILAPLAFGFVLGVAGVVGVLTGGLAGGFALAILMANAGGAWDNAKKYVESGVHGGKGTEAHKATVVGDTVGDPFKDTSGPSLNILIKLMSMVSIVFAGLIVRYGFTLF